MAYNVDGNLWKKFRFYLLLVKSEYYLLTCTTTRFLVYKMPKAKIAYVQNDEPDFIKKFKQKVGYKEGPTVDTKVLVSVVSW